ncbi:MAG: DEAD/DEAH box helicase family protein, partial [Lachnospiraceae bacterium]|nr:DEAD/DEAH box helicase family protein [Lachnospiraceae bacterium]
MDYTPEFVLNNVSEGKKVLTSIKHELRRCDKFQISVAFITEGGVSVLKALLKELENKNIPGEIITTNYLTFSQPRALKELNDLRNITLKMYDVDQAGIGFHTKGYIFKRNEIFRIIIGSSNMTTSALMANKEWNTKIVSTDQGEMAQQIVAEFNELWNSEYTLDFDEFYEKYKQKYDIIKKQREIAKKDKVTSIVKYSLKPNSMQVDFISNLRKIIESGENRALLISATGTGKTYASAFAMRELGFKRVLFLVHRGAIARQALDSFKNVFEDGKSMGMIGAGHKDYECDYIFAMVETLHKEEHLTRFKPDEFDCIVLDEAHHSPANTYQKVMEYFKPKLFLGMTATPDKREDKNTSKNVYELFNYQIAHEIRLQQAMEEDLLCPFHYFGIADIEMIGDFVLYETKNKPDKANGIGTKATPDNPDGFGTKATPDTTDGVGAKTKPTVNQNVAIPEN